MTANHGRPNRRLVIVTGPPRSGTTAVGAILSKAPGCVSLHEPMNFHTGDRCIQRYFEVPGSDGFSVETLADLTERVIDLKLDLKSGVFPGEPATRRLMKAMFRGGRSTLSLRRARLTWPKETIIWKDPFASFAIEDILKENDAIVIVCFRSAAALSASFKRVKWGYSHHDILQKLDRPDLEMPVVPPASELSYAQRGALFWRLTYSYLASAAATNPKVRFLDVSRVIEDPMSEYQRIFAFAGLPLSGRVERAISRTYSRSNKKAPPVPEYQKIHTQQRDISAISHYWSEILDKDEQDFVDQHCQDFEQSLHRTGVLA